MISKVSKQKTDDPFLPELYKIGEVAYIYHFHRIKVFYDWEKENFSLKHIESRRWSEIDFQTYSWFLGV